MKDWLDYLPGAGAADKAAEHVTDSVVHQIGISIAEGIANIIVSGIQVLNNNSADIGALAICICGAGMMLSPLIDSRSSGKWFGRGVLSFFVTVIWRALI